MSEFEEGLATGLLLADGGSGTIIQKTFTQNGTYHAIADAADGYDPVIVDVPIASKSITKNGIYYAVDDDLRGFDPVNVNVPMYWTFQPGETVPPSMITNDNTIEEDAPPSPDDVPYPTQEDPDRYITPDFVFKLYSRDETLNTISYEGIIYDKKTNEIIETVVNSHACSANEEFILDSWDIDPATKAFTVGYHYDWYAPGVIYYDHLSFITNIGTYNPSSSGQNTTTVYGE